MRAVAGEDDSGLQAKNSSGVAPFKWQVGDLVRAKGMAHAGVLCVHQRRGAAHFHSHRSAGDLHIHVQRCRSGYLKFNPGLLDGAKAAGADGEIVLGRRHLEKTVTALTIALHGAGEPGGRVGNGHSGAGNDRAFGVIHRAPQRGGRGLREEHAGNYEKERNLE